MTERVEPDFSQAATNTDAEITKTDAELRAMLLRHVQDRDIKARFDEIKRTQPASDKYTGTMPTLALASTASFFYFLDSSKLVSGGVGKKTYTSYSKSTIKLLAQEWDKHLNDVDFHIVNHDYYLWPASAWVFQQTSEAPESFESKPSKETDILYQEAKQLFHRLDLNKDGGICRSELIKGFPDFNASDADDLIAKVSFPAMKLSLPSSCSCTLGPC